MSNPLVEALEALDNARVVIRALNTAHSSLHKKIHDARNNDAHAVRTTLHDALDAARTALDNLHSVREALDCKDLVLSELRERVESAHSQISSRVREILNIVP